MRGIAILDMGIANEIELSPHIRLHAWLRNEVLSHCGLHVQVIDKQVRNGGFQ
jgi:hypothetical protein